MGLVATPSCRGMRMTVKPFYPETMLDLVVKTGMEPMAHLSFTARCEAAIGEHGIFG